MLYNMYEKILGKDEEKVSGKKQATFVASYNLMYGVCCMQCVMWCKESLIMDIDVDM